MRARGVWHGEARRSGSKADRLFHPAANVNEVPSGFSEEERHVFGHSPRGQWPGLVGLLNRLQRYERPLHLDKGWDKLRRVIEATQAYQDGHPAKRRGRIGRRKANKPLPSPHEMKRRLPPVDEP